MQRKVKWVLEDRCYVEMSDGRLLPSIVTKTFGLWVNATGAWGTASFHCANHKAKYANGVTKRLLTTEEFTVMQLQKQLHLLLNRVDGLIDDTTDLHRLERAENRLLKIISRMGPRPSTRKRPCTSACGVAAT